MNNLVAKFNATHPSICVTLSDVGNGGDDYTKVFDALKAGSGAPDVAQVEYSELPSFEILHSLLNLAPYGAASVKSDFVPWVWQQVSSGSDIYALPDDAGPMGFYYNSAIFAKYGLTVPATWAQFAQEAAILKQKDPSAYMTNFAADDSASVLSLMSQAGAFPFTYTAGSKDITIDFTGTHQEMFYSYWQSLIDHHYVSAKADEDAPSYLALDDGTSAVWLNAAWGPAYFSPLAKKTVGDWRTATLPQWSANQDVSADWGGSSEAVLTSSKHPAQAYEFVKWLTSTMASWNLQVASPTYNFPTYLPMLGQSSFASGTTAATGRSYLWKAYIQSAKTAESADYAPFMDEVNTLWNNDVGPVLSGGTTLTKGFAKLQSDLVGYAKAQGFTVSTS